MTSRRPAALLLIALACAGCARRQPPLAMYIPHTRVITITTVPLLVKEQQGVLPFLKQDFARGGVLDGKEVYAFVPNTITVVEGDTLQLTFVNPEDDEHAFVLHDLFVKLPGQAVTHVTYVARAAGIYDFSCGIPSHVPMMRGQLVVLRPEAVTPAGP
ncbi:MAG TPA: cupredoxin domain-containing protein [Gemmatimonadaceae bacterium]|nr:cupredoxin domain-containing protein [Gemmatimonadaceae bacterium]